MTPKEANIELLKLCITHIELVQNGKLGKCTYNDLQFIGLVHGLIEDGQKYTRRIKW